MPMDACAVLTFSPLQVSLYFPQYSHAAFGVVRAFLRDNASNSSGAPTFLDSDGEIGEADRSTSSEALADGQLLLQVFNCIVR